MKLCILPSAIGALAMITLGLTQASTTPAQREFPVDAVPVHRKETQDLVSSSSSLKFSVPDVEIAASWDPNNVPSAEDFGAYRIKGNFKGCMMRGTDAEAGNMWPDPLNRSPKSARSQWQGNYANELALWGWEDIPIDQEDYCDFRDEIEDNAHHIGSALQALGLSQLPRTTGGNNIAFYIPHGDFLGDDIDENVGIYGKTYVVNGRTFHKTGGHYLFTVNYVEGALYAQKLENPKVSATNLWPHAPAANELPPLGYASEILWSYWARSPTPQNLRYFFAQDIEEVDTLKIIAAVLNAHGFAYVPQWPGLELSTSGPNPGWGEALVGSAIGNIISFLLFQHKAELGIKHITSVTIFRDSTNHPKTQVQLLYKIQNYVPPQKKRADGEMHRESHVQVRDHGKSLVRVHEFRMMGGTRSVHGPKARL